MSAIEEDIVALGETAYRLAARILRREEEARDAVQRAYLSALTKVRTGWRPEETRSWFLKVVANAARDQLRGDAVHRKMEASMRQEVRPKAAAANEPAEAEGGLTAALRHAMESLDEKFRIPVALCFEEGLTQREAAAVLGIPQQTLSVHVNEGLRKLRSSLGRAGYSATPAIVIGALAHTGPAVPAGLTAFIQSLTVAAGSGAAAVGKAAAGAALKISARFGVKKAAGLALGWKVGTVVTAAAIGGAAVVAVNSGMFRSQPAVAGIQPRPSGPVIFEDNFDGPPLKWQIVVGNPEKGFEVVRENPEQYWRMLKGQEGYRGQFRTDGKPTQPPLKDVSLLLLANPEREKARLEKAGYTEQNRHYVGIMSTDLIEAPRFVVEARLAFQQDGLGWIPAIETSEADKQALSGSDKELHYPTRRFCLCRWEFEPEQGQPGRRAFLCRHFLNGELLEISRVTPISTRILLAYNRPDMCIDRIAVYELPEEGGAPAAGGSATGNGGAP